MTDKGLMIQCLKNKHIGVDEMMEQNYILFDRITKAMNEYHQAKLKLLGIADVSNRRELLIAFAKFCRSELPLSLFDSVEQNVDRFDGNL